MKRYVLLLKGTLIPASLELKFVCVCVFNFILFIYLYYQLTYGNWFFCVCWEDYQSIVQQH